MKERKRPKKQLHERISESFDKVVGVLSPKTMYRRMAYRKAYKMASQLRSYRGAKNNRLNNPWVASGGSADQDILNDLPTLRERSRDLNRNDPYATGITTTMNSNTVGSGLRPQSRINADSLGLSPEQAMEFQTKAEAIWSRWAPFADAGERMDFYEIQALVDRQILENGEIFAIPTMIKDSNRPYSLAYQMVESDRVDTPFSIRGDRSVRAGIRLGKRGQPIEYYVREAHPGDFGLKIQRNAMKWRTYPAKNPTTGRPNIFHLYEIKRPGQSRGVPFFAPVIEYFQHLDQYLEAELVSARISACFSLFITKNNPEQAFDQAPGDTNSDSQKLNDLEPGIIEYLEPGESVNTANPLRPGATFEPFMITLLRMISASLNLPYELVAKDFSKSNYSNMRAALTQAYRYFRIRQSWLAKKFCQPTYAMVLEEAVLRGELKAPGFFERKEDWCRTKWIADGWEWVDPLKEIKAAVEGKDANIITLSDITSSRGGDWEELLEQIAKEKRKIKDLEDKFDIKFQTKSKTKPVNQEDPASEDDGSGSEPETEEEPAVAK